MQVRSRSRQAVIAPIGQQLTQRHWLFRLQVDDAFFQREHPTTTLPLRESRDGIGPTAVLLAQPDSK
jgi:hypothetical protein